MNLSPSQLQTIKSADFTRLYIWYNEVQPYTKLNSEFYQLSKILNEAMKEKA